jgi:hypothetical protein
MNKPYVTLIGFLIFFIGILSIILTLVGLNLQILGFLYNIGPGFAFLVYILLVMTGSIIMYLSKLKA